MKNFTKIIILLVVLFLPVSLIFGKTEEEPKNVNVVLFGDVTANKLYLKIGIEGLQDSGIDPIASCQLKRVDNGVVQNASSVFYFTKPPTLYPNNYTEKIHITQDMPALNTTAGEYEISLNISRVIGGNIVISKKRIIVKEGNHSIEKIETQLRITQPKQTDDPAINVTPSSLSQKTTQANEDYKLLAPIPGFLEETPKNPSEYINGMYKILLGFAGALAVMMIMYAGFMYMTTEAVSGKTKAKERITAAVLGLILALSSYLILKTINPDFISFKFSITPARIQIDNEVHGDTGHSPRDGKYCSKGGSKTIGTYTKGELWKNDQKTRDLLESNGIIINKGNCEKVGDSNCTSVYNLNTSKVLDFYKKCKGVIPSCVVEITGGTECWLHSWNTQHKEGNNIVDLNIQKLNQYVTRYGKKLEGSKGENIYEIEGIRILDEKTHYHILNW